MKRAGIIHVLGWSVALTLLVLPLVGLLEGWFAASRWPVRSLRIDAPFTQVSDEAIRATVVPLLSEGFFAVDLDRVQREVAALPWVARAEVSKRWPDRVEVRVREQQAFARWNDVALVNRRGELFEVPHVAEVAGLPDLAGPDDRIGDVVEFYIDSNRRFARVGRRVVRAALSGRGAWSLQLDGGAELMVGRTRADARLARFVDTYPRLVTGHQRSFEYVDLRYSNGYAVRWPSTPDSQGGSPGA